MVNMPDLLSSNSISNLGNSFSNSFNSLGNNFSNSFSSLGNSFSNSTDMNSGNRLQSANQTITDVRSGLNEQNQKLNNLQTALQSASQDINNNSSTRSQLDGEVSSEENRSNYALFGQQSSSVNLNGIESPENLEKMNFQIKSQFISKVEELKQKFIQYKLNEDDSAFQRLYERCGHELDAIKQKREDLSNNIQKTNNILNLRLMNIDGEISKNLRLSNTLRGKIQNEEDEDFSFQQMKEDEVREYRLNIFYMVGIILGSGILVKNIVNFTPKK